MHRLAGATGNSDIPGNPYNVTLPSMGLNARGQLRSFFQGMGILKNFMSVFIHIGSKFGGSELRSKVFMTPTQMYNNIVEYLIASALCQGWGRHGRDIDNKLSPYSYLTGNRKAANLTIGDLISDQYEQSSE